MLIMAAAGAVLLIINVVLMGKIVLMRKAAREIAEEFSDKLTGDTNTLIAVSSRDRAMRRLAGEINRHLKELRRQRLRFVQGDVELKSAVANISHDLRTPLTAISSYLNLLDKAEKSETVERYLEIIKDRTECLKQLTEELFQYSVITSPNMDTATEIVAVNAVLEESILNFYAALQADNITPDIQITEKRIVRTLNRALLSRVFSNLLSNAVKYSDGDLSIVLNDAGEIFFSNNARGLSKVQVERLFDRFYTVESARKSTGLGLSIARTLVEQMGGSISAEYAGGRLSIRVAFPEILP